MSFESLVKKIRFQEEYVIQ